MKIAMRPSSNIGGGAGNFYTKLRKEIEGKKGVQLVASFNLFQDLALYGPVKQGLPSALYALKKQL